MSVNVINHAVITQKATTLTRESMGTIFYKFILNQTIQKYKR